MSLELLPEAHAHVLGLTIGRDAARVHLAGDIDLAAADDLSRLMVSLDLMAYMAVDVDLGEVTFLDSSGVGPLVEATRRRRRDHLSPLLIGKCGRAARYFLDVSGLQGRPHLDLSAWDRLARGPTPTPNVMVRPSRHHGVR
jgi:anti-anti-sigma factor